MNRRLLTILLIAFVIAGVCAWMVYRIVGVRLVAAKPVQTTKIVAAAKDIPLGAVLTAADLTTITIVGTPPKGAIVKPEDAVGRGVVAEIYDGEPILTSRISGPGAGGGLAPTIPPGMRACAIRVDEVVGVAGFVIPGMRVDVMASGIRRLARALPRVRRRRPSCRTSRFFPPAPTFRKTKKASRCRCRL